MTSIKHQQAQDHRLISNCSRFILRSDRFKLELSLMLDLENHLSATETLNLKVESAKWQQSNAGND